VIAAIAARERDLADAVAGARPVPGFVIEELEQLLQELGSATHRLLRRRSRLPDDLLRDAIRSLVVSARVSRSSTYARGRLLVSYRPAGARGLP